jgi:FlaA1/EpsC-like NDP-sugar epimerase
MDCCINNQTNKRIEALLTASENGLHSKGVGDYLDGKVVLVTGAGGSIGSELCRQVCQCNPGKLLLLGRGEYSIYQIQNELRSIFPEHNVSSVIADVCNPGKIGYVFENYRPDVVFHAAAYKFLSFVEKNPEEGVLNNTFGTHNIASIAQDYQVSKFVLISTDKAVHAISVLGATKKLAELLLKDLGREGNTEFISVRFGNVLRSRGSVVPLFQQQITQGGPVTVTHPKVKRFFMSIHEGVRLVLQSGGIGRNGELCILDMGEQMGILDLAETLIRMNGFEPYKDIDITFTGLGSGEKLEEQMFTEEEARSIRKVGKVLISTLEGENRVLADARLGHLREAAYSCQRKKIIQLLKEMVKDYHPCNVEAYVQG